MVLKCDGLVLKMECGGTTLGHATIDTSPISTGKDSQYSLEQIQHQNEVLQTSCKLFACLLSTRIFTCYLLLFPLFYVILLHGTKQDLTVYILRKDGGIILKEVKVFALYARAGI